MLKFFPDYSFLTIFYPIWILFGDFNVILKVRGSVKFT